MTDPDSPAAPPAGFAPVPVRPRHDGWTPTRQRAFLQHLADTGCVRHAAAHVGMTKQSAYALRRRAPNSMFAFAWDAALKIAQPMLHDAAIERALEGVAIPIFYHGEQVGERRVYNDKLLMYLMEQGEKLDRVAQPVEELVQLWPVMMASVEAVGPPPLDGDALRQMLEEGRPPEEDEGEDDDDA
jgi:hypothetical protein